MSSKKTLFRRLLWLLAVVGPVALAKEAETSAVTPVELEKLPVTITRPVDLSKELQSNHWSLRPVVRPPIPIMAGSPAKNPNPIDAFVAAKLAEKKLALGATAARRT